MKRKTYLHNALDIADDKAKYDQYAKNILKDADILSYILKYAVKEFADYTLDEAEAAIEQGLEKGMQQGMQQGIQQGMQQGKIEATIRTAKKFGVNDDNIIQTLMEECSLSEAEAIKELEKYSK